MSDLLEMRNIHKVYSNGTRANRGVSFSVRHGEIHALVGENGAGKSTLMKILFGLETPSEGEIFYKGEKIEMRTPKDAIRYEIGMVHQHFMLVPSFTVAQNIVLGSEPRKGALSDHKAALLETDRLIREYGLKVDSSATVARLSVGLKQRVEILKVLYRGARLIILDEPTAVLTPQETDELFHSLRKLVDTGYTIIFITHKLNEVMSISDRITVLRAGQTVTTLNTAKTNKEEISRLMVGREVLLRVQKTPARAKETVLRINGLSDEDSYSGQPVLRNVSLEVKSGEILGIAGVEGNGQTELIEAITGFGKGYRGSILFQDKPLAGESIRAIRAMGIGHIPEDRQTRGACLTASVKENLILDQYREKAFGRIWFLNERQIRRHARELIERFDIRTESEDTPAGSLSGGNIQKIVVARELHKKPKLLIAAQPTRGVDIGSIEFIHKEIVRARDEGAAVLLVSAELTEIMSLSDRIGVLYNGELTALLNNTDDLTEEEIGYYMLGVKKDERKAVAT
ncbi:ABC transporter ATP-binding protein [Paenibacillus beijingensis]|uniref:ABC transporter ATP-binding protein n=1 Tax=Paenibacillus beijingensis TaxID=1126833 RepID=A0A0D5NG75_9BACL|nr:ABC transporter ATP-binding protein [Paenibacillus beijingensis]AJY74394.1 ABC transporter ATP-binding protein [Paenibacillus beijingensis]